jgi:hypothetical protein
LEAPALQLLRPRVKRRLPVSQLLTSAHRCGPPPSQPPARPVPGTSLPDHFPSPLRGDSPAQAASPALLPAAPVYPVTQRASPVPLSVVHLISQSKDGPAYGLDHLTGGPSDSPVEPLVQLKRRNMLTFPSRRVGPKRSRHTSASGTSLGRGTFPGRT